MTGRQSKGVMFLENSGSAWEVSLIWPTFFDIPGRDDITNPSYCSEQLRRAASFSSTPFRTLSKTVLSAESPLNQNKPRKKRVDLLQRYEFGRYETEGDRAPILVSKRNQTSEIRQDPNSSIGKCQSWKKNGSRWLGLWAERPVHQVAGRHHTNIILSTMSPKQPSSLFFITLAFLLSILCNSALAQDWIVIDDADPAIVYYGDWKQ
ncbi:2696_t:CDS:2, partial [Acaulospora colombiana]